MTRKRKFDPARPETAVPNSGESASAAETASPYAVGYGRPPQNTRFKPGQSGNPRGRPKGARNLETILRHELFEPIAVVENGRRKKVPRLTALIRRLMEKGFAGDVRATLTLLQLARQLAPEETKAAFSRDILPDEADLLDLLTARATRLAAAAGGGHGGGEHE